MDRKQRKRITIPDTYPSLQSKNIKIECRYTPLESLVEFYVNDNYLISLKNVKPIKSDYLTPCIIFLKILKYRIHMNIQFKIIIYL